MPYSPEAQAYLDYLKTQKDGLNTGSTNYTPSSINSSMFQNTPVLNFQSPNYGYPYPVAGLNVQDPFALTQPEQVAQSYSERLMQLNQGLVGESQYRADQEKTQGIPDLMKTQNDLASRLKALQNEALAIPLQMQQDAQGRGITAGGLRPLEAGALRTNAIQALSTSSLLEASRGNLTTALELVDRAVAQKYDPIREEIKAKTANLELIIASPEYTQADKKRAQAQLDIQNKKAQDVVKQTKDYETASAMAAAAIANNPGDPGASMAAQQLLKLDPADPEYLQKAFELVGQYQTDPIELKSALLNQQILEGNVANLPLERRAKELANARSAAELKKLNKEIQAMGGTGITNPAAGKYSGALSVILGSEKFTKDQKAAVINAINSGDDPFQVIKNQAKNIMGQTLATSLDKYETAKAQMDTIDVLLKDFYAKGGQTGLFAGNYEKTINKLGQVNNPELVDIATNISSALQIYRNAVSGTAYSVQEGKDIASIFPGINKTQGLNKAILSGRMKAFDTTIDAGYRNTLGKSYDDLKKSGGITNTPSPLAPQGGTTLMVGPDGVTYNVPNAQVQAFINAGGKKK